MAKNKRSNQQLNRRWFADMSGWGLSLQVGSGEPSKTRRSLPVSIEQKFNVTAVKISSATHNTLYTFNPLSVITPGTGSSQRIGAGIKLKGISFRFTVDSLGSISSLWRVLVVVSTLQFNIADFGSGIGATQLFFTGSSSGNVLAHVDSREAKVICDSIYSVQPTISAVSSSHFEAVDCEINMPFEFQSDGVFGAAANIYIIATPWVPGGTSGTTVVGNLSGEVLTSWAD